MKKKLNIVVVIYFKKLFYSVLHCAIAFDTGKITQLEPRSSVSVKIYFIIDLLVN